ncbi:hypothetical protein ACYSNX_01545 [Myroides sp. LJL115]
MESIADNKRSESFSVNYCELVEKESLLEDKAVSLRVTAKQKSGVIYKGEIFFKGDIGAGYVNNNVKDSIFIHVRRSISLGFIGVDLNGNKYQVLIQSN